MSDKNKPVKIFIAAMVCAIAALICNIISDYAATAEIGRLFRHLSTISIVCAVGLLIVNWADQ